jgi:MFS family permease
MVSKDQYGRANGMMSLVQAGPGVIAPLLAGALLPVIELQGILIIDVITFLFAIGALMLVHVPPPIQTADGKAGKGNFWHEATFGFKYIFQRKPMLAYVILIFIANLFLGFPNSVHVPLVLLRTGNDSLILGPVQTAGAISWTIGSLVMSAWGGPKQRIYGTLFGWMFYCLFGNVLFALGQGLASWVPLILLAGLGSNVGIATSQAILQAKVAPDVQGRVFSARRLLTWFPDTFTPILGGLLADHIMEPAMRSQTWLANTFGWLVGTKPGSGMALIMLIAGILMILTMFAGYLIPSIRNMEDLLPDHEQG